MSSYDVMESLRVTFQSISVALWPAISFGDTVPRPSRDRQIKVSGETME
jgi:hypothetical protein